MNFRSRKIGQYRFKKETFRFITKPITVTILGIALVLTFVGYGFWQFFQTFDLGRMFSIFAGVVGKDLSVDRFGNTNILLLGVGGEGHEGADLTDSVQIVNINYAKKSVNIISLPRDLYVESRFGGSRINKLFETGLEKYKNDESSLEFVRETLANLFLLDLPYAVKIDFKGFEKVIDELDGIDIFIEETIDDPFFPDDNFGYEPFYLPAGNRHLDGETSLRYVRSRKTSSDFERGHRQQQILIALREQARKENILKSPRRLKSLYRDVEDHITTNFDLREMITLASFADEFPQDRIFSWSIHDDPTKMGGFLYTPVRELYGGAFILLPASDDWFAVRKFFSIIFQAPDVLQQKTTLQILNTTKTPGLAANAKMILQRFGFRVIRFGNGRSQNIQQTTIYYKVPEAPPVSRLLTEIIPSKISQDIPNEYRLPRYESEAEVIIELGEDFLPLFDKLDVFRNVVEIKKSETP